MLWSMIWSQRSYVLDNSQSIFRAKATDRQRAKERERERESGFLFDFCLFHFFRSTIHHAFSFRNCRMMFIKGSRFSENYLSLKLIENMCGNASHSPLFLHFSTVNNSRSVLFQPIIARCLKALLEQTEWLFLYMLEFVLTYMHTYTLMDSHSDLVRSYNHHMKTHMCVSLFHLGLGKSKYQVAFINAGMDGVVIEHF